MCLFYNLCVNAVM